MTGKIGRKTALLALMVLALALGASACSSDEESGHVVEGEPIELGDLRFNVQLTRFLNANDREDREYLEGEPTAPLGEAYLGVFMEVENEGDESVTLPEANQMKIVDTTGVEYEPVEAESVFGFPFGEVLGAGGEVPLPDTASASGPIQGSIVLFLLQQSSAQNRPLELEITADGESGVVELDI